MPSSVGSRGYSYDNAPGRDGQRPLQGRAHPSFRPAATLEQVELATARWVARWKAQRLYGACGDVPPAEFEAAYWQRQEAPIAVV